MSESESEPESESTEIERSQIDRIGDVWERAWAGGGRDDLALCCTVDVAYEDPLSGGPLTGTHALDAHVAQLRKAFPNLRIEKTAVRVTDGTYACLPWRISGTHRGDFGDLPATHKSMTMHGMHYVELRDGLICRARGFFDLYDAATQLGLAPKRGSIAESALMMLRGFGLRVRS